MMDELSKPATDSQDGEVATMRRELARAHAAIHWFANVRAAIISGALKAEGEAATIQIDTENCTAVVLPVRD